MKRKFKFWVKERHNPQLGVYYVSMWWMSEVSARKHEDAIYGENIMIPFETEKEAEQFIKEKTFKPE